MLYDFVGKIKNIRNEPLLDTDNLHKEVEKIKADAVRPLTIKVIRSEKEPRLDILVKSQISVPTIGGSHMEELAGAVNLFRYYMKEIAQVTKGDISMSEGFYNNNKTYSPLY